MKAQRKNMENYALNESNYISTIRGITTIKNHNRQAEFQKLNRLIYENFQESSFKLGKINIHLGLLVNLAGTIFTIIILLVSSYDVYCDFMKLGELMAILVFQAR